MASGVCENTSLTGEFVSQKAYTIGGVPIIFPFKAYPSQIAMMAKIVACLNKKQNCLLESPTGSGKSLSLLCAALAWLRKTEKDMREMENVLNRHLNVYGVAVADDRNCASNSVNKLKADFDKYKFPECKSCVSPFKKEVLESANLNNTVREKVVNHVISSNDNVDCGTSEIITVFDSSDKTDKLNNTSSPFVRDCLNKRGIIYIDDEDEDDFQPLKRNKIFTTPQKEIHDYKTPAEPVTDDKYAPENHEDYSNNFAVSCSSSPKGNIENSVEDNLPPKLPKIFFGTRTHKQIAQIIRELKKTPYKEVKMTILSSRERTCIHPKNCKSRNKNEGCDELIRGDDGPACNFYKNIRRFFHGHSSEMSSAFDLEDFVSMCKRKQICPYFGAREMLTASEIVFCPYNYLVDPLIRSALNISLKENIIIMDEAHNIEDSAREAASTSISVSVLQEAIADILQIAQLKEDDSEPYMHIAKVLENLKKWLQNCENLNDYVSFDSSSKVWSGNDMIALLDYVGLGPDTYPIFQSKYTKISRDENEIEKEKTEDLNTYKLSGSTHMCLKSLTETLNYLYKDKLIYVPDYRCVVIKTKTYSDESGIVPYSQSFRRKSNPNAAFEITMNFWCLNPAVAFSDMKNVHSIIVASGTLAPLTSFQSELGIPFQITLEANHVVCKEHMWVGTIGKGPSNNSLNGTFHNASTFAFQDDVGNLVLEVCNAIPHGVLCFLPSYGMLDKLVNRWQLTGLWDKLLCKKVVLCEPRRANEDFQQVMQDFYDAVKDSETGDSDDTRGALFLAVCRGKVSEGLDFADNNARAVITIGIPFPNIKDAQVDLKKKYNDLYSSKKQIVSGGAWYEMQAFRALNQALGRCIRHRNDYGALIIVDERFQKYDRYVGALSKWIKKEIHHYSTFYEALSSLNEFADRMGLKNRFESDQ